MKGVVRARYGARKTGSRRGAAATGMATPCDIDLADDKRMEIMATVCSVMPSYRLEHRSVTGIDLQSESRLVRRRLAAFSTRAGVADTVVDQPVMRELRRQPAAGYVGGEVSRERRVGG
jgi:hypothetical protein